MQEVAEEAKRDSEYKRSDINLDCRFYKKKFPEENDYVKVKVKEIVDNGAYVALLEYNNIEGMITTSEFTTMRLKSFHKVIKEGKQETVLVLRVDKEKGYIDLSKKKVNAEDMKKFEDEFTKAKTVHTILRTVADKCNMDLEKVYEMTAWALNEKFGQPYDAFKISIIEPERVWEGIDINPEVKSVLDVEIKRRLAPNEAKIRADFEMTCYSYEGIEGIKKALKAGEKHSIKDIQLKFQVISAPVYVAVTNTFEKSHGIDIMKQALVDVEATIKEQGGSFKLREAPKVVGDKGDQDLKDLIESLKQKEDSDEDEDSDPEIEIEEGGPNEGKAGDDDDDDDDN